MQLNIITENKVKQIINKELRRTFEEIDQRLRRLEVGRYTSREKIKEKK